MKKRKFLLASTLLVCFSAQYALPVFAGDHSDVFNDTQDHTVTLSSEGTGSITNAGTGSTTLNGGVGNHKFTGSLKNVGGGRFINQTKVTIGENDVLENSNSSAFDNQRSITIESGATFLNSAAFNNEGSITNNGIFSNSGTFEGSLTNSNNGKFNNTGTFTLSDSDNFSNSGTAASSGTFTVGQNSTVDNNGSFENFGNLTIYGTFASGSNGQLTNKKGGTVENNNSITGNFVNNSGIVNNNNKGSVDKVTNENGGIFNNKSGAITNEVINQNGAIFNNENNAKISGNVTNDNDATFNNKEGATISGEVTNQNGAVFNNEGSINNKVTNNDGGIFNNKSSIFKEVTNNNATVNNEGRLTSITSQGGTINNNNGSISGAKLQEGATINNEGSIGKLTSDNSTVNNFQKGTVDSADLQNNSTFNNQGNVNKLKADSSNVNNSGSIKDATIENNANLNNNSNGTITGSTNVNSGSTLYNDGTISDGTITVDSQSTLHLGANSNLDNSYINIQGGHLDLTNGKFDDVRSNAVIYPGSSVSVDLSSATGQTDKLFSVRGVTLEDFNFIPDTLKSNGFISKEALEKNMGLGKGNLSIEEGVSHRALSPLRWLEAISTSDGIGFAPTGNSYKDFNPAIMAGAVAAQLGGYLTELNSYDEAFRNMDMYMLMTRKERTAMKLRNKYASIAGNYVFDPTGTTHDDNAAWIRPYATFESVRLKGGPRVSNVAYGSYFGAESEMYELSHGWDAMWGAYIGYNGSHQAYDGISIYQNGGTLGLVGMLYRGDFFTGLTINTGANTARANTIYGDDDFTLLMAGVASKTGYNWELADGKFIIQPNFMMSYSFVNTFDYTTSSGIKVNSNALSAITFEPGLKFIGNLKNGWQPYMGVSVIWNAMDKTKFQASDATLPELSVKPFAKYGLGIRKTWGERLTGFIQAYFTSGGRNGVGFQAGLTFTFGKSGEPIAKTNHLKPVLAKPEITLDNIKETK